MAQVRRQPMRIRPQVEELEPRVLYSADLPLGLGPLSGHAEQRLVDAPDDQRGARTTQLAGLQLVVVDAAVDDADTLLADLNLDAARVEVLRLRPGGDGIAEIGLALEAHDNVAAVHILAHGEAGVLRLGATLLDGLAMFARADEIAAWGASLGAEADILVYGCAVGDGSGGSLWVNTLASLTGADVAASDDATGSADLGGDWQLERRQGAIDEGRILQPGAQAAWRGLLYANGYDYRRAIEVPTVTGTHSDFPMLVAGTYNYLASTANGGNVQNANGYDIVFSADAAGTNILDHEIEAYDPTTGQVALWVRVPTLASGTTIYMFYGNASVTTSQEDINGTWDANYRGVWHLNESGTGAAGEYQDSTANANNGQGGGATPNSVPAQTAGRIGAAQDFTATESDFISIASNASLNITGGLTLEAWINGDSWTSATGANIVLSRQYGNDILDAYNLLAFYSSTSTTDLGGYVNGYEITGGSLSTNNWYHVAATFTTGGATLYVNGLPVTAQTSAVTFANDANPLLIGANENTPTNIPSSYFDGVIDEARLSATARSANWIATQYANQNTPATFYSIGAAVTSFAPTASNLSAPETYIEDTPLDLTDIVVADADSPTLTVTLTLSNVAAGVLNTATAGGITASFASGVWSASGPLADLNTLLAGLTFMPAANFNGNFSIATSVSDGGNTLAGSKAMTGTPENDPPVITSNGGGATASTSIGENSTAVTTVQASDPDVPAQPIAYSISGGFDAALFQIDAASGALSFVTAPDFEIPGDQDTNNVYEVTVRASDPGTGFDEQALSVQVTNVNEAPVITAPTSFALYQNQEYVFSGANAIQIADADINTGFLELRLEVGHGTLHLASTSGITFSQGANGQNMMRFNGTLANVNAALNGMLYRPASGYTGLDNLAIVADDQGNSGGPAQSATRNVAINVLSANSALLWLTADGNVDVPGYTGTIEKDQVFSFSEPNLVFEPGTTSGQFDVRVTLGGFPGSSNTDVSGIHLVTRAVSVAGTLLERGDLLFTVKGNVSFNGVDVDPGDLVRFHPTATNYTAGVFSLLLDNPFSENLREIALVEQTVTVGDITLNPGDLLMVHQSPTYHNDIRRYVATGTGAGTAGTFSMLVDGEDIDLNSQIGGLHLVQETTRLGNTTLSAGRLLLSMRNNDDVGDNSPPVDVTKYDIFVLNVTDAGDTTAATATLLFQGADVGLNSNSEALHGISIVIPNFAPILSGANNLSDITEDPVSNTGSLVTDLLVSHISDPDGDPAGIAVTSVDNAHGTWQYSTDGSTWNAFGAPSATASRLLAADASTRIRFVPNADWNGSSSIAFRAWDRTSGTVGSTADTTVNGGFSPFSLDSASSNITVTPVNDAPVITSNGGGATAALDRAENTASVTTVTASDIDLPAQTLTYSLVGGADMARFQIGAGSGVLSFVTPLPDYELPGDANQDNIYEVTVQVADGNGGVDSQTLTVTVQDVDDTTTLYLDGDTTPPFSDFSTAAPTGTTLVNFDPARDAYAGLLLAKGGDNLGANQTDDSRHHTWVLAGPVNIVSDPVRLLLWSDMKDGVNAAQTADVAQGKAGSVTAYLLDLASATAETGGTVIASATVSDSSWGDGYAWEQKTFDFGTVNYNVAAGHFLAVKIVVNDASGDDLWFAYDTAALASRLVIGGTNQAPVITSNGGGASATQNVNENATLATTVTATDADSPTLSYGIIGGTDAARFSIHPTTGVLNFVSPPDYENPNDANADRVYNVIVQVSDGAGGTDSQTLDVTVLPVNEAAPVIDSNGGGASASITVNENTSAVTTVTATDSDLPAPALTYSVTGTDAARFSINPTTGVLNFVSAPDYEVPTDSGADNVYDIVVQVSDGARTDTQTLTVTVAPINDNSPIITSNGGGATATVSVNENTTAVTTVTATDADRPIQTLAYSIVGGADAARFGIGASTGVLSFISAHDHETPTDSDLNNSYVVRVRVDDGNGNTDEQTITVTIVDVPEPFDAVDDSASVDEDASVIIPVLTNDLHPDDTLSILGATPPAHGSVTINGDGTLTYAPSANYFGPDSFQYVIRGSDTPGGGVNFWALDGNGLDAVGGAHATTLAGATTITGRDGQALDFDGVDDYVALPDVTYANSFSVSFWFRADTNTGDRYRYLYSHGAPGNQNAINVYLVGTAASESDNKNVLRTVITDENDGVDYEGLDVDVGSLGLVGSGWHLYTLVVSSVADGDGDRSFVYIDGIERQTDNGGGGAMNPSGALNLGRRQDGNTARYFDGALDSVQRFNRALSAAEVSTLYNDGLATATVSLTVNPVNDAPTMTSNGGGATAAVSIAENTTAVTTVTATDIDTPTASLTYSLVSGGDSGRFQINADTGVLSFLAAPDYEAPTDANADNIYNVTVQVSDGAGGSDTQAIAVTVTPVNDNAPVITSNGGGATADVDVAENTLAVTTVTATDADLPAQTLAYAINGGADAARFYINPSTGALSFQIAPNYEAPSDANADNIYVVTVRVRDPSGLEDTQTLNVRVTPVNDNPPVMTYNGGNQATVDVDENTTAVRTLTASDIDLPAQTLTFSIAGGADSARFQVDALSGALSFITAPDYETPTDADLNNIYIVRVQVSDGNFTDTQEIHARVNGVNDNPPEITSNGGGATATLDHQENDRQVTRVTATDRDQPSQTLTYSIVPGDDAALFAIDASGILRFHVAPDYENPVGGDNTYQVTVRASDGTLWDDQVLTIHVQDNDDTGITDSEDIDPRPDQIPEDAIPGTGVGITAHATDPDTDTSINRITYSLENDAGGRFAINNLSGVVSLLGGIDYETASSHYIEVRATSPDSTFSLTGFVIVVQPVNDRVPEIVSDGGGDTADVGVPENTTYVTTVTAEDADQWPSGTSTALVYSLQGGTDAGHFAIDATSGVLRFIAAPDYEAPGDANADNVYVVIVEVSDGLHSDTQRLNVSVTPDNDNPPVFVTTRLYIDEGQTAVGQIVAADADLPPQTLRYYLVGGDDNGLFELTLSGSLSFLAAPNYEQPTDTDGDNVYDIAVRVEDGAGLAVLRNIAIEVRALNDNAPVITSDGGSATAVVAVNENSTAVTRVQASDADLPPQELTFAIAGGADAARFGINPSSGELYFLAAPDFEQPTDVNLDNVYVVVVAASDGSLTGQQEISVRVQPVNDNAPIINAPNNGDPAELRHREGRLPVTDIDASDADWLEYNVTRQTLTYSIAGGADAARFQIDAATGLLSFITAPVFATPTDANLDNVYEVTVRVSDGAVGGSDTLGDTQALRIVIFESNDFDPEIEGGASAAFAIDENGGFATTVRASDADVPAQTLTYAIAGGADAGRFGIDAQSGVLTLNLTPDFEAPADSDGDNVYQVVVQVSDGRGGSDTQAISVAVRNVNEAPEATGIAEQRAVEGEPFDLNVAGAFRDPDAGDRLTYSVSGLPAWLGFDANTGTLSGTPGIEDATRAPLTIVVTATDAGGLSISTSFALTVGNANVAPTANADSFTGDEDTSISGNVLDNDRDLDRDPLSATLLAGPSHGRLTFNADGSFVYTPDADFNGNDGFTYQISDGELNSAPASVTLTVLPVNDAPAITVNGLAITGGGRVTLTPENLRAEDVDSAGDLSFTVMAVSGGQFEIAGQPGVAIASFTQADVAAGRVVFVSTDGTKHPSFTLRAGDGQVVSTPSQGGVDFTPVILINDAPAPGIVAPSTEKPSEKPAERKESAEDIVSADSGEAALVEAALRMAQQFTEATESGAGRLIAAPQTLATAVASAFGLALANLAGFQANPVAAAPFQLAETQLALMESMRIEALDALKNSFGNDTYNKALDQMRQALGREATLQQVVIGSSVALSGGLSIGYVLWLLRGGALLGSLLSAMPAWTLLDPVPVLAYYTKRDKDAATDKTERMFEKASAAKAKTIWGRIRGMKR